MAGTCIFLRIGKPQARALTISKTSSRRSLSERLGVQRDLDVAAFHYYMATSHGDSEIAQQARERD